MVLRFCKITCIVQYCVCIYIYIYIYIYNIANGVISYCCAIVTDFETISFIRFLV